MDLNMIVKGKGTLVIAMDGLESRFKGTIMVAPTKDLVQVDLEGADQPGATGAKAVSASLHNCIIYWDRT